MRRWVVFALLCVVQSFSWILLLHSGAGITAASCAVGACIAAVGMMWFAGASTLNVLGGVCLIVGPWLQLVLGNTMPGSSAVVLALTLVPVVVAVAEPALGDREFSPMRLWPGLAAATGLMIIAPLPSFSDWRADAVLVLIPIAVGIGVVLTTQRPGLQKDRAAILGVSAGVFAVISITAAFLWRQHIFISWIAVGVCAVTFALVLLAVRSLSSAQYASQYAIVPLLALLQGPIVISFGVISWRFAFSVALLLAASVALLRGDAEEKLA